MKSKLQKDIKKDTAKCADIIEKAVRESD